MLGAVLVSIIAVLLVEYGCDCQEITPPLKPDISNPTSISLDISAYYSNNQTGIFNVHCDTAGQARVSQDFKSDVFIYTITGLQPNSPYTIATVFCTAVGVCSARGPSTIARTRPVRPPKPMVSSPTNSSFEVTATDNAFTTGHFELTAEVDGKAPVTINCPRNTGSCVIAGLTSNTAYNVTSRICPGPPVICSDPSEKVEARTTIGEVYDINIVHEYSNNITVNWQIPETVDRTTVEITSTGTCKSFTSTCVVQRSAEDFYQCTFTELPSNAEFMLKFVGCARDDGAIKGVCTSPKYVQCFTIPAEPRQVYASDVTSKSAKISWETPSGNHRSIAKFKVTAQMPNSPDLVSCETSGHGRCGSFCNLYGLTGGSTYTVYVEACVSDARTNHTVCGGRSFKSYFQTSVTYLDVPLIFIMIFLFSLMLIPITLASIYGLHPKSD